MFLAQYAVCLTLDVVLIYNYISIFSAYLTSLVNSVVFFLLSFRSSCVLGCGMSHCIYALICLPAIPSSICEAST